MPSIMEDPQPFGHAEIPQQESNFSKPEDFTTAIDSSQGPHHPGGPLPLDPEPTSLAGEYNSSGEIGVP